MNTGVKAKWQSRLSAFARATSEEVSSLHPRKVAAEKLSGLLPQQTFNRLRTALFRTAGAKIGEQSLILGPIRLTGIGDPCRHVHIGRNTIITGPLHADLGAALHIGDNVRIGHDVTLLTITHAIGGQRFRSGTSYFGQIRIEDGVWIASRVTVLPGVTIGPGAVIATGAVVTKDVPANTMVAGVPARVLRKLDDE